MSVRLIRKLDGLPELKTVHGIVIENDIPRPGRRQRGAAQITAAVFALEPGQSLVYHHKCERQRDQVKKKHPERKFSTLQIGLSQWRVWRMK